MADTPTWSLTIDALSKTITSVALVLGGAVGYNRYLRRREPNAKCDLDLNATAVQVNGAVALLVSAGVLNSGSCRLRFVASMQNELQIAGAFRPGWEQARAAQEPVEWKDATFYVEELLRADDASPEDLTLEPGQRFVRTIIVPVPTGEPPLAYRATLIIEAEPVMVLKSKPPVQWSTQRVVALAPGSEGMKGATATAEETAGERDAALAGKLTMEIKHDG